jgi:hypothetical protein
MILPPPGAPAAAAVAVEPPPVLRYASFDLFGDSGEAFGGSLFAKFAPVNPAHPFVARLAGILAVDPISSSVDDSGNRHTGLGDLWLRGVVTGWVETARRPRIDFQYGVKIPTASADDGLGSGKIDQRFVGALDKSYQSGVWWNFTFITTFKGADNETQEVATFVGQLEIPLPLVARTSWLYAGYLQFDTPYAQADLSSFQQHGVALKVAATPLWVGVGLSLGKDNAKWTSGGYLRLELRP